VGRRETRRASRNLPLLVDLAAHHRGNPDLALAHAMLDRVVTGQQAALVSRVHLDAGPDANWQGLFADCPPASRWREATRCTSSRTVERDGPGGSLLESQLAKAVTRRR
jgi:hypothetical protein